MAAIAVLAVGGVAVYIRASEHPAAKDVFETPKIALPPIVTLILGAYFKNRRD